MDHQAQLREARRLIDQAMASTDPRAQRFALSTIGSVLDQRISEEEEARDAAERLVRPDNVTSVADGVTSSPYRIDFSTLRSPYAYVTEMFACTLLGTNAELAKTSLRIVMNGNRDLVTTGQAGTFVPLMALYNTNTAGWFRFFRPVRVKSGDTWNVYFKNEGGTGAVTPTVVFKVLEGRISL